MSDEDYLMVIAGVAENLAFLMPTGAAEGTEDNWLIHVQVQWIGPDGTRGRIIVALDQCAAEATAANLLGLPPGEPLANQDISEACGELANVIAGNLLPVKYGHDHEFHLHPPQRVTLAPLSGRTVVRLALVEGVIGVAIDGDADNSRILKAIRVPAGERA
jgi:CheY-specific phosphatase CheX